MYQVDDKGFFGKFGGAYVPFRRGQACEEGVQGWSKGWCLQRSQQGCHQTVSGGVRPKSESKINEDEMGCKSRIKDTERRHRLYIMLIWWQGMSPFGYMFQMYCGWTNEKGKCSCRLATSIPHSTVIRYSKETLPSPQKAIFSHQMPTFPRQYE